MREPEFYTHKLEDIYNDIRSDLIDLLNRDFNGHYIRKSGDLYIKQSNIIGTPIVYELKLDEYKIIYRSGLWSGKSLICSQRDYNELTNDCLFEVYQALYKIAEERS